MPPSNQRRHIRDAVLTSLKGGIVELGRDWRVARLPPIAFEGRMPGSIVLKALSPESYAQCSGYCLDACGELVFAFWPSKRRGIDWRKTQLYLAGSFNGWQEAVGESKWRLSPEKLGGQKALALRIPRREFDSLDGSLFKFVTGEHEWFDPDSSAPNKQRDGLGNWNYRCDFKRTGRHRFAFALDEAVELSERNALLYRARKDVERLELRLGSFFFNLGSDKELGALAGQGCTVFRLFAPRAKWAKVGYFSDLQDPDSIQWVLMKRGRDFVWEATIGEELAGCYYWFRLDGPRDGKGLFDPNFKVLDPYAKATVGREGPGIILGEGQADPCLPAFENPQWQDLVVLEAHLRDLVAKVPGIGAGAQHPLGFSDLAAYARRSDFYPKRLGVNAIELQPIQENDSQSYGEYHWGYMTANYFSPHSGYGSDGARGSQVEEFAALVEALHEQGLSVILDVVYNHVGEPAHLMFVDKLYYFHGDEEGNLSNWSGCGNDLRTEAPMAKRLIVDSLKHLVLRYGVDGFRFDLADLVGKPVLQEIERELKKLRPDIILIAEPWSFRGHIGPELRDTGYASWNDGYRNFLKKYVRGKLGLDAAKYFLMGSPGHYATWPSQTVNYVESHDDRVWIDDITENAACDGTAPTRRDVARSRMMIAMLMMSVGMPMLHAGMDFLGTKNGVRNTYQDGERNALDYRRSLAYSSCARYFADWIAFRRSDLGALLRHYTRVSSEFFDFLPASAGNAFGCVYNASGEWGSRRLLFAANPGVHSAEIGLSRWQGRSWVQIADHERFHDARDRSWSNQPGAAILLPDTACALWELA